MKNLDDNLDAERYSMSYDFNKFESMSTTRKVIFILAMACFVACLSFLWIEIRPKIEKSCNNHGGSYLGGMCVRVGDPEYFRCRDMMNSQDGNIAVLPMSCAKYVERLYRNQ